MGAVNKGGRRVECVACGKPGEAFEWVVTENEAHGTELPGGWMLVYFQHRGYAVCSEECRTKAHAETWRLRLAENKRVEAEKRTRLEAFSDLAKASAIKAYCTCPTCISNRRYGTDVPCSREAEVAARVVTPNGGDRTLDKYTPPVLTPERRAVADRAVAEARAREAREMEATRPRCGLCSYFALHGDGTGTCGHHITAKPPTPDDICGAFARRSTMDSPAWRCALDTLLANDPMARDPEGGEAVRRATRKTCKCDECAMWRLSQERPSNPATAMPGPGEPPVGEGAPVPTTLVLQKLQPMPLPVVHRLSECAHVAKVNELAMIVSTTMQAEWKLTPGATVYHKLTGEGPWIAVQPGDLATERQVPAAHDGQVRLSGVMLDDVWTVEIAPDKFKAVPAASLAPTPLHGPKTRRRAWLVGALAFAAAVATRLAWAWFTWFTRH